MHHASSASSDERPSKAALDAAGTAAAPPQGRGGSQLLSTGFAARAAFGSIAVALVLGVPTDVVPNPWFTRMTPVRTLDVAFLAATALLTGALAATYVGAPPATTGRAVRAGGWTSGGLGWLAIGCPLCNKLVLLAIGAGGALNVYGPLQPVLGGLGVALATTALTLRLNALAHGCRLPTRQRPAPAANSG